MLASIAFVLGILIGTIVLTAVGRGITTQEGAPHQPTALGWCAFAFGIVALAAGGLMMSRLIRFNIALLSIALAVASMVIAVGALVKRDRHWPTWVGLGLGAIPFLFWVAFVVGELVGPPH
jgi:hypothetical protein